MTSPTPRTPSPAELPERREPVYEPPMLVEVGSFAEVTRGFEDGPISDFPAFRRGYWLI
jgi:hypothetical protein